MAQDIQMGGEYAPICEILDENVGRQMVAAYNAFDSAARKLDCNAVELGERMQDGGVAELHDCLKDVLSRFRSCIAQSNGEIEGDKDAIARAEAIIAKVKGGAA
jgi:hypothetical protein